MRILIILITIVCCCVKDTSTFWWSIGQVEVGNIPQHVLLNLHRFSRQQKMMIQNTPRLLETIGKGASLAILECKRQFQYRKWNCSTYATASVFGKIVDKACRETSFIYAITSAGATYSLTESCARGILKDCYCHRPRVTNGPKTQKDKFIYEGCHDNIQYGYERGKAFVDAAEMNHDFHAYVNLHNNEAGRQAVIDSMVIRCKCHGVSGNCNVKTCRKALPLFTEVGKRLVEQYETAAKVRPSQIITNRRIPRNHNFRPDAGSHSDDVSLRKGKDDLIFLEESPNFCERNLKDGSLGTEGRYCNSSIRAKGVEGCDVLCCGRKWHTENWTRPERCRCKFVWCCQVTCDECMVTREYSRCK